MSARALTDGTIGVAVGAATRAAIDEASERLGLTRSAVARRAIELGLAKAVAELGKEIDGAPRR